MKLIDGWEIEKLNVSVPSRKMTSPKTVLAPIPESLIAELDELTPEIVDVVAPIWVWP